VDRQWSSMGYKVIVKEAEVKTLIKNSSSPVNRWLDDQEDDGKTERELKLLGNRL